MGNRPGERAAVARAAQQVEEKHQQIHTLQTLLQNQMLDLSSRWSGSAATAFQRDYSQFDTEFEKVKQGLDKIHSALVESRRHHVSRGEVIAAEGRPGS